MNRVCPYCGTEVPFNLARPGAETIFCPGCGHELDLPKNPQPEPPPAAAPLPPPAPESQPVFEAPGEGVATAADQVAPAPVGEPIPWEGEAGFFSRLLGTIAAVLFSPAQAFGAPARPGQRWALTFGVILTTLGSCAGLLWSYRLGELEAPRHIVIFLLVFMPLFALLGMYLASAWVHFFLWVIRGAKRGFTPTFRVVSYSQATAVFVLLPYVGGWISTIWQLVAMTIGLAQAHGISRGRAFMSLVLPLLVAMVLGVLIFVAATGLELSQLRRALTELGF